MAFVGMDTDLAQTQLTRLQTQGIDQIQNAITTLNSLLGDIAGNWKGADSAAFHSNWQSGPAVQLNNILQALTHFHGEFNKNIQEQIATSS
mgnify:CR=1 FL=1